MNEIPLCHFLCLRHVIVLRKRVLFQIALEHLDCRTHKLWKDHIYQTFVTRKLTPFGNATPTRPLLLWVMAR